MKSISKMVCSSKKNIDHCIISNRSTTGIFVAKIRYNAKLLYAVYGYNAESRIGVRITDYYSNESELIAHYPASMFVHWHTYFLVSEV